MSKRNLIILAGLILVFWAAFPFIVLYSLPGENNTWVTSGTFGDTYGALNALFSGVTILGLLYTVYLQINQVKMQTTQNVMQEEALEMQRKELKLQRQELALQRDEMAATRNEFVMNRVTVILYNQLERIDDENLAFTFQPGDGRILKSEKAFESLLDLLLNSYLENTPKERNRQVLAQIYFSYPSILRYVVALFNSVSVLKEVFLSGNFTDLQVNELKNIFFLNVGNMQMNAIKYMHVQLILLPVYFGESPQYYTELGITSDYFSNLEKRLGSINDLRNTLFTTENIEENKANWGKELRGL